MRTAVRALQARAQAAPDGSKEREIVLECLQLIVGAFGGALGVVESREDAPSPRTQ